MKNNWLSEIWRKIVKLLEFSGKNIGYLKVGTIKNVGRNFQRKTKLSPCFRKKKTIRIHPGNLPPAGPDEIL